MGARRGGRTGWSFGDFGGLAGGTLKFAEVGLGRDASTRSVRGRGVSDALDQLCRGGLLSRLMLLGGESGRGSLKTSAERVQDEISGGVEGNGMGCRSVECQSRLSSSGEDDRLLRGTPLDGDETRDEPERTFGDVWLVWVDKAYSDAGDEGSGRKARSLTQLAISSATSVASV